jgi:hypothetical protein
METMGVGADRGQDIAMRISIDRLRQMSFSGRETMDRSTKRIKDADLIYRFALGASFNGRNDKYELSCRYKLTCSQPIFTFSAGSRHFSRYLYIE